MIPFSTSRSLIHAVPPFGWAGLGGSNGATSSHSESSTYSVCIPTYYQVFTRLTVGCETASYVYDASNALTKRIVQPSGTLTYCSDWHAAGILFSEIGWSLLVIVRGKWRRCFRLVILFLVMCESYY